MLMLAVESEQDEIIGWEFGRTVVVVT